MTNTQQPNDYLQPAPRAGSLPQADELIRYITFSGESDNIDAKGPTEWDGGVESAKLAKDIAAFANSRDGGVLVIGKEEAGSGTFVLKGVSQQQADSFDTTKVATWINNRLSPPIRLVCHRIVHAGMTFIVITVAEFDDVPVLCIKSYQDPKNAKDCLLREKTIYVRKANAESAPLGSVDDLRTLIGLAAKKKGEELLATFGAMLKGRPLIEPSSDDDLFQKEASEVLAGLDIDCQSTTRPGAWCVQFHPGQYQPNRWNEVEAMESLIAKNAVRLNEEFPPCFKGTHAREWGIANTLYGEVWTLTRSGLFTYYRKFRENDMPFQRRWRLSNGELEPEIPPGKWIEFLWNLRLMAQFFMFMARMASAYEPGETIQYRLNAGPLQGRQLGTVNLDIDWWRPGHEPDPCQAREYTHSRTVTAEDLRTGWEDECASAMKRFYELFPGHRISRETLRQWVDRFKKRDL